MLSIIDKDLLIRMLKGGAAYLDINKENLNALNVFPVPDGDTGTNMGLTMASCVRFLNELPKTAQISDISTAFSKGSLVGARGNSGVILSQILKGMGDTFIENPEITTKNFAKALKNGADKAYDAVTKPKEGTILTVIRLMGEHAAKTASRVSDFEKFFDKVLEKGRAVLQDTPNLLPVLKQAGVVDAGGQGLIFLLEGMQKAMLGEEIVSEATKVEEKPVPSVKQSFIADVHNLDEITFGYCTEFFVINIRDNAMTSDIDKLRDKLMKIGDCVVVVGDLSLVKVHVHTNQPNLALQYGLQLGELDKLKIENMLEQNREIKRMQENIPQKPMGIVAVSCGDGLSELFKELGVDKVVSGGQTMNTSVTDIVDAVNSVNAETVFVLPDNKNIILAAEQAISLASRSVVVIATTSVPEGISAAIAFNPEADVEENTYEMQKAASGVKTAQITKAVRDVTLDGFDLKTGDVIGIEKGIIAKGDNAEQVAYEVVEKLVGEDNSVITLYYGDETTDEQADALMARIQERFEDLDVMSVNGGQPYYSYLLAIE